MGRKPKPKSGAVWIPGEVYDLVVAIKKGDRPLALKLFSMWMETGKAEIDAEDKPNVF